MAEQQQEASTAPPTPSPSRRGVLKAAAVVGLGSAMTLPGMTFASAATGETTKLIAGRLEPGAADWVYLPVDVPQGVREIAVSYSYDRPTVPPGVPGNALDIGIFDQRGIALDSPGFRGWSGGFRTEFAISRSVATPGYLPGPISPGRWHVVLGPYQVAPQGLQYSVQVTLRFGEPGPEAVASPPPVAVPGTGPAWYRGDLHLHTVHSDGRRTPKELAAAARAAGLDFIASTEHNTSSAHAVWGPLAGDDLLVILGEEVTTRNGHWLALGLPAGRWIDWRYRSLDGDFDRVARRVQRDGGLVVPAHPFCPFVGCRWKFGYDDADAVEVWNGPWTLDDDVSLEGWDAVLVESARGKRRFLPAVGTSDAHNPGQTVGLPHTVVRAESLGHAALLDGVRLGRSWLAESSGVSLELVVTGGGRRAGLGERLPVPDDAPVAVTVTVGGAPGTYVRILTDEGQMIRQDPDAGGAVRWRTTPRQAAYVRAEVRRTADIGVRGLPFGSMVAMTNPVFLGRGDGAGIGEVIA